jgi:nucleotide-binding universal stress UspA family protein
MFKQIFLATDGSPASQHAAQLAINLTKSHAAELTVLYVVDPYPYLGIGETNPLGFQAYMSAAMEHAGTAHATVKALAQASGLTITTKVIENVAAATGIVESARLGNADLIVVGSHGRTGIKRLMLGSVAAQVVAQSDVPVLVAR